jgi:RHS repeat-associated protein
VRALWRGVRPYARSFLEGVALLPLDHTVLIRDEIGLFVTYDERLSVAVAGHGLPVLIRVLRAAQATCPATPPPAVDNWWKTLHLSNDEAFIGWIVHKPLFRLTAVALGSIYSYRNRVSKIPRRLSCASLQPQGGIFVFKVSHRRPPAGTCLSSFASRIGPAIIGTLVIALLLVPGRASATALPPTITENTTLMPAGNPYTGSPTIEPGVTVKVEPGVKLTLGSLTVKGTLDVDGTAEEPVVFTGAKEAAAGEWGNVRFQSGSGASVIDHAELKYGGSGGAGTIAIEGVSPKITNSTIRNSYSSGIYVNSGGGPEIANNDFLANADYGIYYLAGGALTGEINIHDNFVEGGTNGIYVGITSTGSVVGKSLGANTIVKTTNRALYYRGKDIPGNITDNTLIENSSNVITIFDGTVATSSTWNNGSPIKVESGITVASGVTLKITKGALILNPSFTVKGTLESEGTAAEPVVLTGAKEAGAGEWSSIKFEPGSSSSTMNNTEIAYGGSSSAGMIAIVGAHPTITNSTIRRSQNYGIKVTESGSPRIEWNRFRSNANGLSFSGTGNLAAPNNDWGCVNGPRPAGCGDSVTSNVSWKPAIQLPELAGHCRGKESQCGEGADPVSLATGQLNYSHRDLLLTNKSSTPLEFVRAYSSGSSSDTGLGPGWSQSGLASATELESGAVLVLRQDGRQDLFYKAGKGVYKAPSGVTDTLSKIEGIFQLTTLQGTVYRFDASSRIASIIDNHGLKTTYAYSAEGRLATITDPSGQTLTFTYNASNHIILIKDSTGREIKFGYSAAGDLETVTDVLGGVTKYAYDAQHRITSITDPRGNVILKNVYDSQGRMIEQRDGLEDLWKLEYSEGETVVTEPEGGELSYGFDSQDRVVSETDQLGHKTTTGYDSAGNVSEVVKPGGAKWTLGHDAAGNLTSVKDPEGGERKYEYDLQNRLTGFTDALARAWNYEWSKANDLMKIVDPEEGETTFIYNESGQPLMVTDANGHKTEFSYDSRGNRLNATDSLGHKTSFEYNSRSYLTSTTAPGLKAESFERNALGDLLSHTTPEGNKTKYVYDANGLPTQITDPSENVWKMTYNAMERPTVYTDPLEQEIKVAYNGNLKPTKVTSRRGKETTYGYDVANQLTEVDQPEGGDWQFGYDSRGNRSSVVDPRENEATYEYDLLDRMTAANEPLATTTEYGYDANGELTSVTNPRENTTSYAYDKLGRLTEVAQPLETTTTYTYDGVGDPLTKATAVGTLNYGYDAANRLTSIAAGESTLRSFGYDAADRLTSATDAESHKLELGYDNDNRVTSIKDGRGQSLTRAYNSRALLTKQVDGRGTLEYGYDKLGRMTSLTDPQGKALSFAYDPEGDLIEAKRPNGVTTTNVYNDAGRLAETSSKEELGTTLEALEYGYDPAGNIVSKLDARLGQETTFAYDPLNRITEFNPPGEGSTSYGYDEAGNRTEAGGTVYEFNALNQLIKASDGTAYSYDGAGRMTGIDNGSEKTSYEWDLLSRLAKAEGPTGTASYAYDGLERLSERKDGESTQVTHYGDLTDLPIYEADGEGKTTASYVQGAHGLVEQRSGEAMSFPLADAHGDITAVVDGGGTVTSRQSWDPWGNQLSGSSAEFGWLGAQQRAVDPATGLIQMGARSYAPELGAFLSEDPVLGLTGLGISANRYPYAWNNPLSLFDLDGELPSPSDVAGAVGGTVNDVWDTSAGARDFAGIAGNGNGGVAGDAFETATNYANHVGSFWSDRYNDFIKNLKESCGTSFGQNALHNFTVTNTTVPGLVAPTLSGAVVNRFGGVAAEHGTLTAYDWLKNSRNLSQLPAVARAAGVSWIYASLAWEAESALDRSRELVSPSCIADASQIPKERRPGPKRGVDSPLIG